MLMTSQDEDSPKRWPLILIALMLSVPLIARAMPERQAVQPKETYILKSVSDAEFKEISQQIIIDYIYQVFPEDPVLAVAIAKAESNLVTNAHGDKNNMLAPKGSHGIFQINVAVHQELIGSRDVTNYKDNIDIAREIYDAAGRWTPWGAFTDRRYLQFVK